jgi:hypothetical protein
MALEHASTLEMLNCILALREEQPVRGARDGDAEEVVERPKVSHRELRAEARSDVTQEVQRGGRQVDVVDVEQQVGDVVSIFINKETRITSRGREGELTKIRDKLLVPHVGSLLHAVEGLLQQTYMIRCKWVDEARWLLAVDGLLKTVMVKGILDIKLVDQP